MNLEISWEIIDKYFTDNKSVLIQHQLNSYNDFFDNTVKFKVPTDNFFFMGDNRDNSKDSRAENIEMYVCTKVCSTYGRYLDHSLLVLLREPFIIFIYSHPAAKTTIKLDDVNFWHSVTLKDSLGNILHLENLKVTAIEQRNERLVAKTSLVDDDDQFLCNFHFKDLVVA